MRVVAGCHNTMHSLRNAAGAWLVPHVLYLVKTVAYCWLWGTGPCSAMAETPDIHQSRLLLTATSSATSRAPMASTTSPVRRGPNCRGTQAQHMLTRALSNQHQPLYPHPRSCQHSSPQLCKARDLLNGTEPPMAEASHHILRSGFFCCNKTWHWTLILLTISAADRCPWSCDSRGRPGLQ